MRTIDYFLREGGDVAEYISDNDVSNIGEFIKHCWNPNHLYEFMYQLCCYEEHTFNKESIDKIAKEIMFCYVQHSGWNKAEEAYNAYLTGSLASWTAINYPSESENEHYQVPQCVSAVLSNSTTSESLNFLREACSRLEQLYSDNINNFVFGLIKREFFGVPFVIDDFDRLFVIKKEDAKNLAPLSSFVRRKHLAKREKNVAFTLTTKFYSFEAFDGVKYYCAEGDVEQTQKKSMGINKYATDRIATQTEDIQVIRFGSGLLFNDMLVIAREVPTFSNEIPEKNAKPVNGSVLKIEATTDRVCVRAANQELSVMPYRATIFEQIDTEKKADFKHEDVILVFNTKRLKDVLAFIPDDKVRVRLNERLTIRDKKRTIVLFPCYQRPMSTNQINTQAFSFA
jgi:hypothetical protein